MTKEDNPQYYLGLDWGRSWVGLALADEETKLATAYGQVAKEQVIAKIESLAQKINLRTIIVGMIGQLGDYSSQQKRIEELAGQLKGKGFLVEFEKEDFSTKLAQANLLAAGKKAVSKNDNAEAARIILQGWLDKQPGAW